MPDESKQPMESRIPRKNNTPCEAHDPGTSPALANVRGAGTMLVGLGRDEGHRIWKKTK